MIEPSGSMVEWADYYQRISVQQIGDEVNVTVAWDHDSGTEVSSTVVVPEDAFKDFVGLLFKTYGRT